MKTVSPELGYWTKPYQICIQYSHVGRRCLEGPDASLC